VFSTNSFLLSLKKSGIFHEGLVVTSDFQINGRGQKLNQWESEKASNLLISILIEPKTSVINIFDINRFISLSVIDLLNYYQINACIKWPNDIMINHAKIAGILIENIISKNIVTHSIVGIGLNINQSKFKIYKPPATSLLLELKDDFDIKTIKDKLLVCICNRLKEFRLKKSIIEEYNNRLFLLNKSHRFIANNKVFYGTIKKVLNNGCIMIQDDMSGKKSCYTNSELKYFF
jgi:BirA family biotin operon repressor/biotin-[acetyl-CoA-carboxylase] ligase